MSQVIDIFILDTLENNEIVIESLSTNNGNRSTFPSLSSPSEMPITQAYDHSSVLPMNWKKYYVYFTKKIMRNFHAFPAPTAHVYYTHNL